MEVKIYVHADKASNYVAKAIAEFVLLKNSRYEKTVLGLVTGKTAIKANKECLFKEISSDRPASYLQEQQAVEVILDKEAGLLIRRDKNVNTNGYSNTMTLIKK